MMDMVSRHQGMQAVLQEENRQLQLRNQLYEQHNGAQALLTPDSVMTAVQNSTLNAVRQRSDLPHMIVAHDVARHVLDTLVKAAEESEESEEMSLDDDTPDPIEIDDEDDNAQENQNMETTTGQSNPQLCHTC